MKAAIIGIGLIGGSFALSLKDKGICSEVWGVDNNEQNCKEALSLGLVDKIATLDEIAPNNDINLIVLATPVNTIPNLAVKVLNKVSKCQTVMDMGSIKADLLEMIECHSNREQFVATHPMWGTENSGPSAAMKGAFSDRTVVICNKEDSNAEALMTVASLYKKIGMNITYMSGEEQDMHSAYVSHISHISSFALALTVLEKEREQEHIFSLAAAGFESTVRLAKSSPSMWTPIFLKNKYNILDVLREHIHQLQVIRKMIEKDDSEGLTKMMEKANTIKKILK